MANNVGVAVPVAQWPQINGSQDSLSMNGLGMPPDIALQEQRLNRRQQLANVLLQRSLQPMQGQMVGRFYVPPSWAQGLAQLGTAAAGAGLTVANDNKMRDLSRESGNQLQQAMQDYQQKLAPKAVEQDAYGPGTPVPNTVSYDMQNMPDPSLTPSGTFDIDKIQPDRSREVSENINKIAMLMSPGEIHAGDLQGAIDKGQQYTRQPFSTPESQITIPAPMTEGQRPTGTQYVERTPEERQQALVELLASQHPQAQRIAQMLMQQEQQRSQHELQAKQALLMQQMQAQAALNLKGTPSADALAKNTLDEKLHGIPSGNARLQAIDQVTTLDPVTGQIVPNQAAIDAKEKIAAAGAAKQQTIVNSYTPASEEAQKKYMDASSKQREALQSAPQALANIDKAKALIPAAKGFMGPGGESLLEAAKFLNNRMGFSVNTEGVKSAEELRSRIFFNIMDSLKKMDAQPSELQQRVMQDSLGKLGTDPNALPAVLDAFADSIRGKVDLYNKDVEGALNRGIKFPYEPKISLPGKSRTPVRTGTANGRKVVEYSDGSIEYAE